MRRSRPLHVQVLTTQRCNAVCDHCDKAVGLAKLSDIEMTGEKMCEYVDDLIEQRVRVNRLSLSGGEPVVNRELQEIIDESARVPGLKLCRILTNDLNSTREKRSKIKLPDERFQWHVAPLDDLDDPKSGKNKKGVRYRDQRHFPFWISPADIGIEASFHNCSVRKFCGRGLDNMGWSMCGQAPILGRVLGIDPYPKDGTILEKVNQPIEEICKHCVYGMGLPKREQHHELWKQPFTISPTYQKAFKRKPANFVQLSMEKVKCNS